LVFLVGVTSLEVYKLFAGKSLIMDKNKLQLQVITPNKTIMTDTVDSISVMSATGQLTILPKHANLFTPIVEGELKIIKDSQESFFATGRGLLEVTAKGVSLILEDAFHSDEINEQMVAQAKEAAEKILKEKPQGTDINEARSVFRRSLIELKVAKKRRRPL